MDRLVLSKCTAIKHWRNSLFEILEKFIILYVPTGWTETFPVSTHSNLATDYNKIRALFTSNVNIGFLLILVWLFDGVLRCVASFQEHRFFRVASNVEVSCSWRKHPVFERIIKSNVMSLGSTTLPHKNGLKASCIHTSVRLKMHQQFSAGRLVNWSLHRVTAFGAQQVWSCMPISIVYFYKIITTRLIFKLKLFKTQFNSSSSASSPDAPDTVLVWRVLLGTVFDVWEKVLCLSCCEESASTS